MLHRAAVAIAFAVLAAACSDEPADLFSDADTDVRDGADAEPSDAEDARPDADTGADLGIDADAIGDATELDVIADVDRDADVVDDADDAGDVSTDIGADSDTDADAPLDGIGPEGGVISVPGVRLIVPPGALATRTRITITQEPTGPIAGFVRRTSIYRFEPEGLEFAVPFDVCFRIDTVRPANMTVFWTDDEGGFHPISAQDRPREVCGRTDHFSRGFVGGYDDPSCAGIDCPASPASCAGGVATAAALSVCLDGECLSPSVPVDCAAAGLLCVAGQCTRPPECGNGVREAGEECDGADVGGTSCSTFLWESGELGCDEGCVFDLGACAGDPCETISCDEPPPPACLGDVVVTSGAGTCQRGGCVWSESLRDCAAEGATCADADCVPYPGPGDLMITEYMANAIGNDEGKEWFEIYNRTDRPLSLRGMLVSDDGIDRFTVDRPVVAPARGYVVFGAAATAAPTVDFDWGGSRRMTLANGDDEIALTYRGVLIDRVAYDDRGSPPWPDPEGASVSLDPSASDNDDPTSWCTTRARAYGATADRGSPRVANPPCRGVCGDALLDSGEQCDDGNTTPGDGCGADCRFEVDPCARVTCTTPPRGDCDENIASTYTSPGTCVDGTCHYPSAELDCSLDGRSCAAGRCVNATPGALVVTEFLANPDGTDTGKEWFEVYNPTSAPVALSGLVVSDLGSNRLTITGDHAVPPGAYFVFGQATDAAPGEVDLVWTTFGSFTLGNTSDEIILTLEGVELDRVAYDTATGWLVRSGVATSLSSLAIDPVRNDDPNSWCAATGTYGVPPNLGSPGQSNPSCGACGDGELRAGEECDDGNTVSGDGCTADCRLEECVVDGDCGDPPAPTCDGDFVVYSDAAGECLAGACSYAEASREDCGSEGVCAGGACVSGRAGPGALVITEYMADPAGVDDNKEWFEFVNTTGASIDLRGMVVSDADTDRFVVDVDLTIPAGGRMVFAETLATIPGEVAAFGWNRVSPAFALANSVDEIILTLDGIELDRVEYSNATSPRWPTVSGTSVSLTPAATDHVANDVPSNWCNQAAVYDGTNRGTPGLVNPPCP